MRRHGPDGEEHSPQAYVFGDDVGAAVSYLRTRRRWQDAVLRAHGHEPTYVRGKLDAASRAAYHGIGLHLHDLRREFASRLLEASADLAAVQSFLGHASVTTTSRYLKSTPTRLARALALLERPTVAHGVAHGAPRASQTDAKPASENHANLLN